MLELDQPSKAVLGSEPVVGSPGKILIVGQAPCRAGSGRPAFSVGRSAERLAKLMGFMSPDDLLRRVCTWNVIPEWPGAALSGKGAAFPLAYARAAVAHVRLKSPVVVFLGGAADAFGLRDDLNFFWHWLPNQQSLVARAPHVAAVNRWWNTPNNRRLGENFFSDLGEMARGRRDFPFSKGARIQ